MTPAASGAELGQASARALRGAIGRAGFFTLAFGAVVGSGWVVVLGDWLKAAGPGGAALGFLTGAAAMMLIALCYGELAARAPQAGGEFLYALQELGPLPGFLVGWFLTLFGISVCAFEAIALGWLVRSLVPAVSPGAAYTLLGSPVTWDALLIGGGGALAIGALHCRGAASAIRFQNVATFGFIAFGIVMICCGLSFGSLSRLEPLLAAAPGKSWIAGALWIFATCAFFLNGWQAALHAIEERRAEVSLRGAMASILAGIFAAALFYCGLIFAASSLVHWPSLIGRELPAVAAFSSIGTGLLGTAVIVAAAVSLSKTWSAIAWLASRLVFAQARHGFLPRALATIDAGTGAPRKAVVLVTALTLVGVALGRAAVLPIINMVALCLALSMVLCLIVLLRRRRLDAFTPAFRVPGGKPVIVVALTGAIAMVAIVTVEPFLGGGGRIPLEWLLIGIWLLLGVAAWTGIGRKGAGRSRRAGKGAAVTLILTVVAQLAAGSAAFAQGMDATSGSPGRFEVGAERNVFIRMRDGARLATDLYKPLAGAGSRFPVVLMRTPYGNFPSGSLESDARFFTSHGYVVAVQDKRGKYRSEGVYTVSGGDAEDGYDTIDWLSRQPWSNGKVGTYGCSYLGDVQIFVAQTRHPALKAMIPQASGSSAGSFGGFHRYFGVRVGGAVEWAASIGWFAAYGAKFTPKLPADLPHDVFTASYAPWNRPPAPPVIDYSRAWYHLPMKDALKDQGFPPSDFEDNVSRRPGDPYWSRFPYMTDAYRSDVPALFVNSWYDFGAEVTLAQFNHLRAHSVSETARANQYAIMSPHAHCSSESDMSPQAKVGSRPMGDTRFDYWNAYLTWFARWLKEDPQAARTIAQWPKLRYYLMGRNEWKSAESWPVTGAQPHSYYLSSREGANSLFGDGALTPESPGGDSSAVDTFIYDPANPVPSLGGAMCCTGTNDVVPGAEDQRAIEARRDVLVYTSAALASGIEVTGTAELVLFVSSSAVDTDFTAKLVDVYPDGRAFNVLEGILRARYREGQDREVRMQARNVYEVRIPLGATGNYFGAGHRLRVEVSSSNFPRFDRNLNVGGNNAEATRWVTATNAVHHSAAYPSRLVLPVVSYAPAR